MALTSSLEYQTLEVQSVGDVDLIENSQFGYHFRWLDKLILYTPLWCPLTPTIRRRNNFASYFMAFVAASCSLAYYIWGSWLTLPRHDSLTVTAMWIIKYICNLVSRYLQMYYFWNYFKYPWHFSIKDFPFNSQFYSPIIKHYKYIAIVSLIL